MYSILFSAVTGMFAPPGFNSSICNKNKLHVLIRIFNFQTYLEKAKNVSTIESSRTIQNKLTVLIKMFNFKTYLEN